MSESKKQLRLRHGARLRSFIRQTPAAVLREKESALFHSLFRLLDSSLRPDGCRLSGSRASKTAGKSLKPSAKASSKAKPQAQSARTAAAYQPLPGEPSPPRASPGGPVSWEGAWSAFLESSPRQPPGSPELQFAFPAAGSQTPAFYIPKRPAPGRQALKEKDLYIKSRLGFLEPAPQKSKKIPAGHIAAFILPGRAFDRQGRRLGRGGGFYDRALAAAPGLRIGLAWDIQIQDEDLPEEAHDLLMDAIVTESFVLIPKIHEAAEKSAFLSGGAGALPLLQAPAARRSL